MSLWQEVVTAALVGSDRQSLTLPKGSDRLSTLLSQLDPADPEGTILSAAAAISLHQKAGKGPLSHAQPLPSACDLNDLPRCSIQAQQYLHSLLEGEHQAVLPEWLRLVAKAGQRVPEEYLPALLQLGKKQSQLRQLIFPVLGKRGYWLAAQNRQWDYVIGAADLDLWETATQEARFTLVQQLRTQSPDRARELIASTWKEEKAETRATFLAVLEHGLSMADEPFLEAALDDRSKQVRRTAADLLARLPESRLCQRMIERLEPLLIFTPRKPLEVILPKVCDEGMQRDGIGPKPVRGLGEKAWWLIQMLGAVPPAWWCQIWKTTPKALLLLGEKTWQSTLAQGWAIATQRHQDIEWADALLTISRSSLTQDDIARLLMVMPPDHQQAFLLKMLQSKKKPLRSSDPVISLLQQCCYPWSKELSLGFIERLCNTITASQTNYDWQMRSLVEEFACYIQPSLCKVITTRLGSATKENYHWNQIVDPLLACLQFRQQMLQGF